MRLEQWQEAEDALQHASRLDCNSSLVWGHLALLLLSVGEDRWARGFFCTHFSYIVPLCLPYLLVYPGSTQMSRSLGFDCASKSIYSSLYNEEATTV